MILESFSNFIKKHVFLNDIISKDVNPVEIEESIKKQNEFNWNLYNERQFAENLFYTRFNYLIIMFSIFITAAASTENQVFLTCILFIGFIATSLMSIVTYRLYIKIMIILKIISLLPSPHFFGLMDSTLSDKERLKWPFPVNSLIGVVMPFICTMTFFVGTILAIFGIIKA